MKRHYLFIILIATSLLVAGILLNRSSHNQPNVTKTEVPSAEKEPATTAAEFGNTRENSFQLAKTNLSAEDLKAATAQSQLLAQKIGITPGMTPEEVKQKALEWYRMRAAQLVPEQKLIAFYGKVVDGSTNPIAGASIHFIWSDASKTNGTSETDSVSDSDGSFSLTQGTGSRINIYVSKEGYDEIKSLDYGEFDVTGNGSSPENPILFHFRKKGAGVDLITSQYGVQPHLAISFPRNNSPIRVDFFNRKVGQSGQLEISQKKPVFEQYRNAAELETNVKEWSYRLTIPDGGLVETSDEFPFEAPASGYQPVVEFKFQKGDTNWTEHIDKTFYIAFGTPRKYGRIHVETSMTTGTILEYAINPDGSRNLEPSH